MARKKKILLHIGPNPSGLDGINAGLLAHQYLFDGVEHQVAGVGQADLDRAVIEMLRTHKAVGLSRRDVEGAWAQTCRSLLRSASDLVLSQPGFAAADEEQAALVTDVLAGLDVHVVTTPADDEEPDALVAKWSAHLKAGRVHVAPLDRDAELVDLAEVLAGVALCIEKVELDARIRKLKRRRKGIRSRIAVREAS